MGKQTAIAFPPPAPFMEDRLLKLDDVTDMTTLSRTQIYELVKSGKFPPQVQLTKRSIAWKLSDVQSWMKGLVPIEGGADGEGDAPLDKGGKPARQPPRR